MCGSEEFLHPGIKLCDAFCAEGQDPFGKKVVSFFYGFGNKIFCQDHFFVLCVIGRFLQVALDMLAALEIPEVECLVIVDCVVIVILK